jgi:ABC-type Fe3+ transport system permease subunit
MTQSLKNYIDNKEYKHTTLADEIYTHEVKRDRTVLVALASIALICSLIMLASESYKVSHEKEILNQKLQYGI